MMNIFILHLKPIKKQYLWLKNRLPMKTVIRLADWTPLSI